MTADYKTLPPPTDEDRLVYCERMIDYLFRYLGLPEPTTCPNCGAKFSELPYIAAGKDDES